MPPVFKPTSPSQTALWSWLVASDTILFLLTTAMKLASSPSRNSSITTRLPAEPNALSLKILSKAEIASLLVLHIITPLPAAKPSAFITVG